MYESKLWNRMSTSSSSLPKKLSSRKSRTKLFAFSVLRANKKGHEYECDIHFSWIIYNDIKNLYTLKRVGVEGMSRLLPEMNNLHVIELSFLPLYRGELLAAALTTSFWIDDIHKYRHGDDVLSMINGTVNSFWGLNFDKFTAAIHLKHDGIYGHPH